MRQVLFDTNALIALSDPLSAYDAELMTGNLSDFTLFEPYGLRLAEFSAFD